jgi:hypothetical protein
MTAKRGIRVDIKEPPKGTVGFAITTVELL